MKIKKWIATMMIGGAVMNFTSCENENDLKFIENFDKSIMPISGTHRNHAYVDLGLSVKWAACNVGASSPDEYGGCFAWGETQTKKRYVSSTYKWYNANNNNFNKEYITKYTADYYIYEYGDKGESKVAGKVVGDNLFELLKKDDVAYVKWGGMWRMPTVAEMKELVEKCYWKWTDSYRDKGVSGYIVYAKSSDEHIFLLAAGGMNYVDVRENSDINRSGIGEYGSYWTSSVYEDEHILAYSLIIESGDGYNCVGNIRFSGWSVRPVCDLK